MASEEETDFFDIYNFELQLREKINDLHWKTESLEEAQKELSETRRTLYETQMQLEDERRSSQQLKIQLKTALESSRRLEEDNCKNQTEQVRIRMRCETATIERDVLINQARETRLENMDLKVKIEEFERNLVRMKMLNETLEASLTELRNSVARLYTKVQSNVGKLEQEQEKLRKSFEATTQFGQSIKEIIKTSHVARERDRKTIEKLKQKIDTLNVPSETLVQGPVAGELTDIGHLHLKMESTLRELRCKLESNSIEDKLSLICAELCKMDGHLTKN